MPFGITVYHILNLHYSTQHCDGCVVRFLDLVQTSSQDHEILGPSAGLLEEAPHQHSTCFAPHHETKM